MNKGGHIYKVRNITPARMRRRFLDGYIFSGMRAGISQAQIARQIEGIAGGDPEALKTVPPKALEGVVFPPKFTYSREAVRRRVHEILRGVDPRELAEWRKITNERCEESWMSLYPQILKGDTDAVNSGMRILQTQGRVLGFWVDRAEVISQPGMIDAVITREMLDRLSDEELATLDFLIQKMHGKEPKDAMAAPRPTNTLPPP